MTWTCTLYNTLTGFATRHPGVLFLAAASAVFAMPPKGSPWSWSLIYDFFYDWFHGWIGMRMGTTTQVKVTPDKVEASSTSTQDQQVKKP